MGHPYSILNGTIIPVILATPAAAPGPPVGSGALLEDGTSFLLLESGSYLLLES